jgi:hypothetical protein
MEAPSLAPDQTRGPEMHRKLGAFEHLLWLVDHWSPRHFVLAVRIEGARIAEEDLRLALIQAQSRHPILRAAIRENGLGVPEFISSNAPIPLRVVRRTHDSQWLHEVEMQLGIPFEHVNRPFLRVVLVQGEAASELVVIVHHSIGDGVSAMFLVRDLLESMEGHRLEELPAGDAFEDRLPNVPANPSLPHPTLPTGSAVHRPQRPVLQVFELAPDELSRMVEHSRAEGTTLQGVLLAALLLSLPGDGTVQCLCPINIRSLLPGVKEDFGLYISSGMASLDRKAAPDFWSLARLARGQVLQGSDPQALRMRAASVSAIVAANPTPQETYERVWRRFGYDAVLTNFGRFPLMPRVTRFRVTAVYPILSPELEPVVAVATADECAFITLNSPPAFADVSSRFLRLLRQQTN